MLMKEFGDSWQQGVLLYDQGTLYLYQKEWDKALAEFAKVPLEAEPSPVLYMHTKVNSGIAYLEKGRALVSEGKAAYHKALYCYRSALRAFEDAEKSACRLKNLVSIPPCWPLGDIPTLKQLALEELAFLLTQFPDFARAHLNVREGVALLSSAIQKTLGDVTFLESLKIDDKWHSRYVDFFKENQESWLPLWKAQQELWEDEKLTNSEWEIASEHFFDAYTAYLKVQQIFDAQKWPEVRQTLEKAAGALKEVMQSLEKDQPSDLSESETPIAALEKLLKEQGDALELSVSFPSAKEGIHEPAAFEKSIEEAQKKALSQAAYFPALVLAYQTKIYRGSSSPRCQARPWGEVMPLFDEGLQAAQKAALALKNPSLKLREGILLQEKAYQSWEHALALLKQPRDPKEGCQGEQQQKSDKNEKQEEKKSHNAASTEDVLRLLQELDQQDQLPKTDQIKPKEGLRPW
jgi:hypothetical protein